MSCNSSGMLSQHAFEGNEPQKPRGKLSQHVAHILRSSTVRQVPACMPCRPGQDMAACTICISQNHNCNSIVTNT